jgi:hypothetical protein
MYYLKITKIKYVKNGSKLEHLGIVHYDIFGQLNAKFMHSRCRISLNFINSFSWFIAMYLSKHKSFAFENFKHHKLRMEN